MLSELSACAVRLSGLFQWGHTRFHWPASAQEDSFQHWALRLFRLQFGLNQPYQALCRSRGIQPGDLSDWNQIPAVPTSAFKEFDFSCLPHSDRTHYFESSGTTQTRRSRTWHSPQSLRLYEASLLHWFQTHLAPETAAPNRAPQPARTFISLTPSASLAPHSSLVHMMDVVSRQAWFGETVFAGQCGNDGAWSLDFYVTKEAVQKAIVEQTPLLLVGTAFNFVHLLDELDLPLQLPQGSRIMETGGYKGRSRELSRAELHSELNRKLGITPENIVTEYGMSELGSQAYDHKAGSGNGSTGLRFPPWARISIISTESGREVADGETGLIRVVDLANAFSVIAIETEDLAIRRGDGFELIGRRPQSEPRGCSLMSVAQ